jgi:hypothetical protein
VSVILGTLMLTGAESRFWGRGRCDSVPLVITTVCTERVSFEIIAIATACKLLTYRHVASSAQEAGGFAPTSLTDGTTICPAVLQIQQVEMC